MHVFYVEDETQSPWLAQIFMPEETCTELTLSFELIYNPKKYQSCLQLAPEDVFRPRSWRNASAVQDLIVIIANMLRT